MGSSIAENVLATAGTVFWCIQLVPQIIRNYKVKDCEGLPPLMMFLWAASGVPFSIYFFGIDGSIPLRIQPQLFTFFCTVAWLQTLYYPPIRMSWKKILAFGASFTLISAGLEAGFIVWLRPVYRHGTEWPMLIFGIIASVLLAIGLLPPYFELAKRKGRVIGINFVFLTMDSTGALLSMLSILVGTFDVMSMVLYAIVLAMEIGIFTSHTIWYLRFGRHEKELEQSITNEDLEKFEADAASKESEHSVTDSTALEK